MYHVVCWLVIFEETVDHLFTNLFLLMRDNLLHVLKVPKKSGGESEKKEKCKQIKGSTCSLTSFVLEGKVWRGNWIQRSVLLLCTRYTYPLFINPPYHPNFFTFILLKTCSLQTTVMCWHQRVLTLVLKQTSFWKELLVSRSKHQYIP